MPSAQGHLEEAVSSIVATEKREDLLDPGNSDGEKSREDVSGGGSVCPVSQAGEACQAPRLTELKNWVTEEPPDTLRGNEAIAAASVRPNFPIS